MNNITNNCMYYTPDSLNNIYTRDLLNNTQNNFSLLSLNCQSLKTHWDAFSSMLHQAGTSGFLPDVIGLTEVFKIPSHLCFDINGYKPLITKTRPDVHDNRGGVGMYIKEGITSDSRPDLSIFIPHVIETMFVEVINPTSNKPTIVGSIYRPNSPLLQILRCF